MVRHSWPFLRLKSALAAGACSALVGSLAHAQSPVAPADAATAQVLFDEGKKALSAKDYAAACPKFAESQRLDPGGGTALALAMCLEGQGRTASAWAAFREAVQYAKKDKRADREASANEHIAALEPALSKLVVTVKKAPPGLTLKRDGLPMGQAQVGVALPVDPGEHVIEAAAPQKKAFRVAVTIAGQGSIATVEIPELEDEALAAAPSATPDPVRSAQPRKAKPAPPSEPEDNTNRYILGGAVAGVGVVAGAIGVILASSARSQWKDTQALCPNNRCPTQALVDDGASAGKRADVATVMFLVGGAAVAAGAVIFLTAPTATDKGRTPRDGLHIAPALGDRMGAITLGGTL